MTPARVTARAPGPVHYCDGALVLSSSGHRVVRSEDGGRTWRHLCSVPVTPQEWLGGATRVGRRLLRSGIYHIAPGANQSFSILGFGSMFRYSECDGSVERTGRIVGSRPLIHAYGAGLLAYGEYRSNPERTPVCIWCSRDDGRSWTAALRLSGVRHIHGVFVDPYTDAVWFTTGDLDSESGIFRASPDFVDVEPVLQGSQQTRVVQLVFTSTSVYFGSDAPEAENHIYRFSRDTGRVETLQTVAGPVFFGCRQGGALFFSTACEPSRVNVGSSATLWQSYDGNRWFERLSFRKDRLPMRFFQYGQLQFPAGPGEPGYVWVTPYAARPDQQGLKLPV